MKCNHLLAFERKVKGEVEDEPAVAKTILAFMVRGLFTPLRFAYAQFPCAKVTGELLLQPFWQAIYHLERMTFKVYRCFAACHPGKLYLWKIS